MKKIRIARPTNDYRLHETIWEYPSGAEVSGGRDAFDIISPQDIDNSELFQKWLSLQEDSGSFDWRFIVRK